MTWRVIKPNNSPISFYSARRGKAQFGILTIFIGFGDRLDMSEICPSILRTLSGIPAEGCPMEKCDYKYRMFSLLCVVDSACWLHDIEKQNLRNDFIYATFKQSPEFPGLERLRWEHLEMNVHISLRSLKTGLRFCRLSPLAQEVME